MQIPITIYLNKKTIRTRIILYFLLMLFFIWGFWYGSDKFFTEPYYYPKMVFFMPVCVVVMLVMAIKEVTKFRHNGPMLELSATGIKVYGKPFEEIGVVPWKDISGCADFTEGWWTKEKFLYINVHDTASYYSRIEDVGQRQKFISLSNKRQNALFWINAIYMDCDLVDLKRTIYQSLNKQQAVSLN